MTTKKTTPITTAGAINIPGEVLKAALIFAARRDIRYYLNGVSIEVDADGGAAYVAATDGHRMFACRVHQFGEVVEPLRKNIILAIDDVASIAAPGANIAIEGFEPDGKAVRIRRTPGPTARGSKARSCRAIAEIVEGRFPDWRRVIAAALKADPAPAVVNTRYLYEASQAQKLLGGFWKADITSTSHLCTRGTAAATYHFRSDEHEAIAAIMPMRDDPFYPVPAWCQQLEVAKPKKQADPVLRGIDDSLYLDACREVGKLTHVTIADLQRLMNVGWSRASDLITAMLAAGRLKAEVGAPGLTVVGAGASA